MVWTDEKLVIPADVLWWTRSKVCIRCPHCAEDHEHDISGYIDGDIYTRRLTRAPHCRSYYQPWKRPNYYLDFPFQSGKGGGFEICKTPGHERFLTVSTSIPSLSDDDVLSDALVAQLSQISIGRETEAASDEDEDESEDKEEGEDEDESGENIAGQQEGDNDSNVEGTVMTPTKWFFYYVVTNRAAEVSKCLERCPHLTSGEDGIKPITMAIQEGHTDVVRLIAEHGIEITGRNKYRRTCLMEAALWGRLDTFKYLLDLFPHADEEVERALALSENEARNEERRKEVNNVYTVQRDDALHREIIQTILRSHMKQRAPPRPSHRPGYFSRSGSSHVYMEPIAKWDADARKAVAILDRGSGYPRISAMSGWGHSAADGEIPLIAGRDWTEKVHNICHTIKYNLGCDPKRDGRKEGNYNACHAEKQLVAYFINKHIFLPHELEADHGTIPSNLVALSLINPPETFHPHIVVNWEVCDDCKAFLKAIETTLNICFTTHSAQVAMT